MHKDKYFFLNLQENMELMNNLRDSVKAFIRRYIYIYDQINTEAAAERIKNAIWFRGPNVWILAFSIVIASVGLNVNSTAVIIGAMLISPLMGPIIGVGLSLGTNDFDLLRASAKNLMIMVIISLFASTLFFLLSPLSLVNPTELEARTSPTIYDVLIALFGGLAGILENSRREQGTAIAGVAIATALMPPLCTAGYGLAHWDMHFFVGALYLFIINSVFIALATYLMVKYLRFKTVSGLDEAQAKRRRNMISTILTIVLIPSIYTAAVLIVENNFERDVQNFVENERLVGHSYIYDYKVEDHKVRFEFAGEPLTDSLRTVFYDKALAYNIKTKDITIKEHHFGMTQQEMNSLVDDIYRRTDRELDENDAQIEALTARLEILSARLDSLELLQPPADTLQGPLPEDEN